MSNSKKATKVEVTATSANVRAACTFTATALDKGKVQYGLTNGDLFGQTGKQGRGDTLASANDMFALGKVTVCKGNAAMALYACIKPLFESGEPISKRALFETCLASNGLHDTLAGATKASAMYQFGIGYRLTPTWFSGYLLGTLVKQGLIKRIA